MIVKGRIWKFGDNIDTDIIIPAQYLAHTDPKVLGQHCMEPLAPNFPKEVRAGDIIVSGSNFGCGSSREHAPLAIAALGIPLMVVAKTSAILPQRLQQGPALRGDIYDLGKDGDEIEADISTGIIRCGGKDVKAKPIPPFMVELINEGGLINHLKKKLEG